MGLIKPTHRPGSLEETIRLLPEGIGVVPLTVGLKKGNRRDFDEAITAIEEKVAELAAIGVDLIAPAGAPPLMVHGYRGEQAGEAVVASLASANRDAAAFADADRLDLARQDNPHVAFGHGIHHCTEAQLARIELQVAMGALIDRFPALDLAVPEEELAWGPGGR